MFVKFLQGLSSIALSFIPLLFFMLYYRHTAKFFKEGEQEEICFLDFALMFLIPYCFYFLFKEIIFYPALFSGSYIVFYILFLFFNPLFMRYNPSKSLYEEHSSSDKSPKKRKKAKGGK